MFTRILSVVITVMITNTCFGSELGSNVELRLCKQTLNACDAAYSSQKVLIKDLKDQVGNLAQKNILQDRVIQDQKTSLDDPLKDPIKVGLGAAVITVVLLLSTGHLK